MNTPATFGMKRLTWRRWALVGAIPAAVILALFIRVVIVGSPEGWIFLSVLVAVVGFCFHAARRQLMTTRLTLDESGFRYLRSSYDINVPWKDVRTVTPRMRGGKLVALAILTSPGKYILLSGFEHMQDIADFIASHVKSTEPDAVGSFRLNKNTGWLFIALFGAGVWMKIHYGEQSALYEVGLLLQIAGIGGIFWLSPFNFRMWQGNRVRRFFVLLAIWVLIVVVAVLVLDVFSPKH